MSPGLPEDSDLTRFKISEPPELQPVEMTPGDARIVRRSELFALGMFIGLGAFVAGLMVGYLTRGAHGTS